MIDKHEPEKGEGNPEGSPGGLDPANFPKEYDFPPTEKGCIAVAIHFDTPKYHLFHWDSPRCDCGLWARTGGFENPSLLKVDEDGFYMGYVLPNKSKWS